MDHNSWTRAVGSGDFPAIFVDGQLVKISAKLFFQFLTIGFSGEVHMV